MSIRNDNNIVLIGMPASGKSTVGVILAKILGKGFIDTDIEIQKREGIRLSRIIEERGIDEFLKCEEQALMSINVKNTVISTGGSAVYSKAAMEYLSGISTIVYLHVAKEELKRRLRDIKERGIALRPGESIDDMYDFRSVLYTEYADITVYEEDFSIEDTIQAVVRKLKER